MLRNLIISLFFGGKKKKFIDAFWVLLREIFCWRISGALMHYQCIAFFTFTCIEFLIFLSLYHLKTAVFVINNLKFLKKFADAFPVPWRIFSALNVWPSYHYITWKPLVNNFNLFEKKLAGTFSVPWRNSREFFQILSHYHHSAPWRNSGDIGAFLVHSTLTQFLILLLARFSIICILKLLAHFRCLGSFPVHSIFNLLIIRLLEDCCLFVPWRVSGHLGAFSVPWRILGALQVLPWRNPSHPGWRISGALTSFPKGTGNWCNSS